MEGLSKKNKYENNRNDRRHIVVKIKFSGQPLSISVQSI